MVDTHSTEPDSVKLYRAYENWKGWDRPFTFTADEEKYFTGECTGLRIAAASVFEIGFGSGNFLEWARTKDAAVAGSEINQISLDEARAKGIEVLRADFEQVASQYTARFDTVVSFDVFEHFSLDEIMTRLHAVEVMLKPGGHLLMRFPNAQSPFGLAPQNGDPTHRTALSRDVFDLLLQGMNYQIVRYGGVYRIAGGGPLRGLIRLLRRTLRLIIGSVLNFAYANSIPYDPVVVIVLRKGDQ